MNIRDFQGCDHRSAGQASKCPPKNRAHQQHQFLGVTIFASVLSIILIAKAHGQTTPTQVRAIPEADLSAYPKNLVRNHIKAEIKVYGDSPRTNKFILSEDVRDTNKAEIALLADDPTIGYPLVTGSTTVVYTMREISIVRRLQFLNLNVRGTIAVYSSTEKLDYDDPAWKPLVTKTPIGQKTATEFRLPATEAQFLRVDFQVEREGRIAGFAVFGEESIQDFLEDRDGSLAAEQSDRTRVDYDLASLYAGAHIRFISSASDLQSIPNTIDDSALTGASFSPDDEFPTIVVDLGRPQPVNRVSVVSSSHPGVIEIFLRDSKEDDEGYRSRKKRAETSSRSFRNSGELFSDEWKGPQSAMRGALLARVSMQPAGEKPNDKESREYAPVARVEDGKGIMRKSATFEKQVARFVMLRFKPSAKVQTSGPFLIYDISAFGDRVRVNDPIGSSKAEEILDNNLRPRSLGVPVAPVAPPAKTPPASPPPASP